jgi:hypothetical protein
MYLIFKRTFVIIQAFVVTFNSKDDRDYYVQKDPAHQAFVETLGPVDDVVVVDFEA